MSRVLCAVIALGLVGCATPEDDGRPAPDRIGVQEPPDTCGAARYAHLLGRRVSEAPAEGSIANYRLATDNGPITADYSPTRLNIFYNERTGRIVGIKCG